MRWRRSLVTTTSHRGLWSFGFYIGRHYGVWCLNASFGLWSVSFDAYRTDSDRDDSEEAF